VPAFGHSQGSFLLRELIAKNIDHTPSVRRRLVSAILFGGNVLVKRGSGVGGDFQHVPACRATGQLGCLHLADANIALGNLVGLVKDEAAAFQTRTR
jgi:hypothetical protein